MKESGRLVKKYDKIVKEYKVSKYNEEMTKKDFILPLFRALGWIVEDSSEVTAEEKISKKRVDYGFRINGISKFFLEAKSLKKDLDKQKFFEQAIDPGGGEDMAEKEWKEALRIVEAYDKMVNKWIQLLNKGRKQAARKYEIKLETARQLAMRAMAKADRA